MIERPVLADRCQDWSLTGHGLFANSQSGSSKVGVRHLLFLELPSLILVYLERSLDPQLWRVTIMHDPCEFSHTKKSFPWTVLYMSVRVVISAANGTNLS